MLFIGEKSGGCGGQKNRLTSHSQTFPIALKTLKKQEIKKKKKTCTREARNKEDLILGVFPLCWSYCFCFIACFFSALRQLGKFD